MDDGTGKKIGIYVHIPFCVRKCLYCDFVSFPKGAEEQVSYVDMLLKEISESKGEGMMADTLFFGGGTPSVPESAQLERIMDALHKRFSFTNDCECSIEVNPGTVTIDKLKAFRRMGFNRISIGLQSTVESELQALGRIHTYEEFLKTYQWAREAGFDNINVDLMSAIPGQTRASYLESLKRVAELGPEHISAYSLIIEPGTPFENMQLALPDEDTERLMYEDTKRVLAGYGYERYEISNYAKSGFACRHNERYWKCREYLGFGIAAASYLDGERWGNDSDLEGYMKAGPRVVDKEHIGREEAMSEFMFLGLRRCIGVSRTEFEEKFGESMTGIFGQAIRKHMENGLLAEAGDRLYLTDKGLDVSNFVLCDFTEAEK